MCVYCRPIYSGRQVCGRTTPGSHRRKEEGRSHRRKEGRTGFLIHLTSAVLAFIFLARRIQPLLSLADREAEFLCTDDHVCASKIHALCLERHCNTMFVNSYITTT